MSTIKLNHIPSDSSFGSSRETINSNFDKISAILQSISLSGDSNFIYPTNPSDGQVFNLTYNGGHYIFTPFFGSSGDSSGNKYWLVSDEKLVIKARTQHLVSGGMIQEQGSEILIENTGQLVVL